MRAVHYFSLIVMVVASLMTVKAIAEPAPAGKVHLLNNLEAEDARLVKKLMLERGYEVVDKGLFTESTKTVSITKANADESDPASIEINVFSKNENDSIPVAVFNHKSITEDLTEALKMLPRPDDLPKLGQNHAD